MQHKISTTAKAAMLLAAASLSGCAFIPDHVHPKYQPTAQVTKLENANEVSLSVLVKNEKKRKRISVSKNGYGQVTAGVYMQVKKVFQKAFTKALEDRGFQVIPNAHEKLKVIVLHFYLTESHMFLHPTHHGYTKLNVAITSHGHTFYSGSFSTHTYVRVGTWESTAGRSKSTRVTLNKIVNKVVTDPQVIDAIFRAAGKTPPPDVAGATVPAGAVTQQG